MLEKDVIEQASAELYRATKKFGPFNSYHEGYAVILEEMDELWDAIKRNSSGDIADEINQVIAMSLRFAIDLFPL